jgi:hypothetical protein
MASRLNSRAENREHVRIGSGKFVGRDCGNRSRSHFRDQAPVDHRNGLARFSAEKQNYRMMCVNALVVGIEGYKLGSERAVVRRHQAEKTLVLGDGKNGSDRLNNLAAGEIS